MEIKSILGEKVLIEWRKMQSLQPDNLKLPYNIAYLKQSLIENNFAMPFFGWQNGEDVYVIDGHQRLQVLIELEGEGVKIPELLDCQLIKAKDRKEAVKILLKVYNQRSNPIDLEVLTEWINIEQVEVEVQSLNVVDVQDIEEEAQEILEAEEDEFDLTPPETPETVLGDLYEIGEHRLLCGDSTDSDQVAKLMNGQKADMVFTDPPYGMNLDTNYADIYKNSIANVKNQDRIIGDDKDFNFIDFYALFEYVKEQFWWGADYYQNQLPSNGGIFVWDKVCESMEGRIGNEFELCWSKQRHKKEIIHIKWAGFLGLQKEDGKRQHPTQKPIRLCESFISRFSKESNLLIDPFLGSGSTMVASHQLKRKCYGMELDPKYCDVIIKRMIKLDSNIKVKRNGIDETKKWLDKIK
jgi:DNA modification methylase